MKILIHVHIYYPEMWPELKGCINNISATADCDVYITMGQKGDSIIKNADLAACQVKIITVENRGFDIGAFIHVLNQVDLNAYDYVVKLHTKRNITTTPWYINGFDVGGSKWREYLLRFCSSPENWHKSLNVLSSPDTGMVADFRLILKNEKQYMVMPEVEKYIPELSSSAKYYVAGTMFAVKAEIFKPLQNKVALEDFPLSNRQLSSSFTYEFERLLGNLGAMPPYKVKSFDGCKIRICHSLLFHLKKFIYYRKQTPEKIIIKFCAIPVYRHRIK